MGIVLRWSLRMTRDNPRHTFFTILNLVFNFAQLTGVRLFICNRIKQDNTDGDGLLWYISTILAVVILFSTILTMYNAFRVTIYERRHRYALLSTTGATKHQIRSSLFIESLMIDCASCMIGIAMGEAVFAVSLAIYNRDANIFHYLIDGIRLLFSSIYPSNRSVFDGFLYVQTPQRGLHFLILEFLMVPMAMSLASIRLFPISSSRPKKPLSAISAEKLPFHNVLRRLFGVGGEMNRLMDKRESSHRRFFLSAFVIIIASLSVMIHTTYLLTKFPADSGRSIYLRTFGDSTPLEQRLDDYLDSDEFHAAAEDVFQYRLYKPQVYGTLRDGQIAPSAILSLNKPLIRSKPRLYPIPESDEKLFLPEMLFLNDTAFSSLCDAYQLEEDVNALLLPGKSVKGKNFSWLNAENGPQTLSLRFYKETDKRFLIADKRTKDEQNAAQDEADASRTGQVTPDYSCRSAQAFLNAVRALPSDTVDIRVQEIPADSELNQFREEDRSVPTLIFPEQARASYEAYLTGTGEGLRLSVQAADSDVYQDLFRSLSRVLDQDMDGCVAEHTFGTGTRYQCGNNWQPSRNRNPNSRSALLTLLEKNPALLTKLQTFPVLRTILYTAPHPIYADLYIVQYKNFDLGQILTSFSLAAVGLMLFTMLTNIINLVYGHHIMRRHDYAVLQSCGLSERQTRRAILYEACWYSVRSVFFGFCGYLLLFPPCMAALSYGAKYERIRLPASHEWCAVFLTNYLNAWSDTLNWVKSFWWIFPLFGLLLFVLFLLTIIVVRHHMRADTLIPLLKKDT